MQNAVVNNFEGLELLLRRKNFFNLFELEQIGVFGSFVRGESYNDIDFLLDEKMDYNKRVRLKKFLEKELQTDVDIIIKPFAEPIILHRALKDIKYAKAKSE